MWTEKIPHSLPNGEFVVPDPDFADTVTADPAPVMWMTSRPVEGAIALWRRLWATREITGLYPLLLPEREGLEGRPWGDGELDPVTWADVEAIDVEALWRSSWDQVVSAGEPPAWLAAPGAPWPGLAPRAEFDVDPDDPTDMLAELDWFDTCRVGLVPAKTGAEAVATLGWLGPVNHWEVAPLAAFIRSWEERYGFRLIVLGFDTMYGSHAYRPIRDQHGVGTEHYLVCPDELEQTFGGDKDRYLAEISAGPGWGLWWD